MKFLVLGCNGMAGHTISLYLKEQGHNVLGVDRVPSHYIESIAGDARNTEALRTIIADGHFDTIINCIGILNQFAERNKALAAFLNAYRPHFLAEATSGIDTQVIHMSTDCVFSGRKGQYTEDDFRDGEAFFGLVVGTNFSSRRSTAKGGREDKKIAVSGQWNTQIFDLRKIVVAPRLVSEAVLGGRSHAVTLHRKISPTAKPMCSIRESSLQLNYACRYKRMLAAKRKRGVSAGMV